MQLTIQILSSPLYLPERLDSTSGGIVRFSGVVRQEEDSFDLSGLTYEAYQPMAEIQIRKILEELGQEHPFYEACVLHRIGFVPVGEAAIIVKVRATHRSEAFAVTQKFMDNLKKDVPIWKVENASAGISVLSATPLPAPAPPLMSIESLWSLIDTHVSPLPLENIPIQQAKGRTLQKDIFAVTDIPPFDQSAMDGFGFTSLPPPAHCPVLGTIKAGETNPFAMASDCAIRIMTGAQLPAEVIAIAKQEDCLFEDQSVCVKSGILLAEGDHIRKQGAVLARGACLLPKATLLTPGAITLLATTGIKMIPTIRLPSVLHLITGDELIPAGQDLLPGQIYDSNGPMLAALLQDACSIFTQRNLGDLSTSIYEQIADSCEDLLLISGGSGAGDYDHTAAALRAAGFHIHTSQINSQPGKPLIFATRNSQVAFGLPGNPLSHWVCFHAFVRRALLRFQGLPAPTLLDACLETTIPKRGDGRRTWTPGKTTLHENHLSVHSLPWKHSGDLTPLALADCLIFDQSTAIHHSKKIVQILTT